MIRIALPKGRMSEETLEYLCKRKIASIEKIPDGRKLLFRDEKSQLEFLLIRSKDVAIYVEQGAADLGVIGLDLIEEHQFELPIATRLPFGNCRLSVAYLEGRESWQKKRNIKVATKYPRLAIQHFYNRGYNIQIIELYGSIELAPITGIADVIVDLVSTGKTLKANKLKEENKIMESTAALLINPAAFEFKRKPIVDILDKLNRN